MEEPEFLPTWGLELSKEQLPWSSDALGSNPIAVELPIQIIFLAAEPAYFVGKVRLERPQCM